MPILGSQITVVDKKYPTRVMQMLGDKIDEKKTFEPPKEPVNKGKTPAFADVNPIWLPN